MITKLSLGLMIDRAALKNSLRAGFAEYEEMVLQQKQQALTNKAAAEAKLIALGLDLDDLRALGL
jgi:hypothetical protein